MEIVEILKVLSAETDAEGTIEIELSTGSKTVDPLRQAILKTAFEGRLVQQDPSEEPAECLLARLNECAPKSRNRARQSRSIVEANA
jgi:type I restriction enzyme S subunit